MKNRRKFVGFSLLIVGVVAATLPLISDGGEAHFAQAEIGAVQVAMKERRVDKPTVVTLTGKEATQQLATQVSQDNMLAQEMRPIVQNTQISGLTDSAPKSVQKMQFTDGWTLDLGGEFLNFGVSDPNLSFEDEQKVVRYWNKVTKKLDKLDTFEMKHTYVFPGKAEGLRKTISEVSVKPRQSLNTMHKCPAKDSFTEVYPCLEPEDLHWIKETLNPKNTTSYQVEEYLGGSTTVMTTPFDVNLGKSALISRTQNPLGILGMDSRSEESFLVMIEPFAQKDGTSEYGVGQDILWIRKEDYKFDETYFYEVWMKDGKITQIVEMGPNVTYSQYRFTY